MKRMVLMILRNLFILPYWFYKIFQYENIEKYDEATRYGFLHKIVKKVNHTGRVTIDCHGLDNLPLETGYIMFPNHQGLFDALTFLETHERPFSVVMKKEVKDIFLIKQVIQLLQAQIIDREDVRQSMKVIMNMSKEVKEGRNYIIFAEGTRTRDKNNPLEFKGGSFKSAMNAKCPIVPVTIIDSYKSFDTNSIAKLTVQIHYLKPLYYEDYKDLKSVEIAKIVEDMIRQKITEYEQI